MAKYMFLLFFSLFPFFSLAQTASDSITLSEVTIRAERVQKTADGYRLYPSAQQLASAKDGYGLIACLSLPQIKVNEALQSIEANGMVGLVEVRINGVPATPQDLLSLDMKSVSRVDYIERPGLVYGHETGRVIHIRTRRAVSGYILGGQVMQAFTTNFNRSSAYAKYNHGRHELALNYNFHAANWNRTRSTEHTAYLLSDQHSEFVVRDNNTIRDKRFEHNVSLKYSNVESDKYVMQAALSAQFNNAPANDAILSESHVGSPSKLLNVHSDSEGWIPQADCYFQYHFPRKQTLTANAVGTYMRQKYNYRYGSPQPYGYHSEGRQYSLYAELAYRKEWKGMEFSLGGKCDMLSSRDNYQGSISTANHLDRRQYKVYAQLSGSVWSNLNYQAAVGYDGLLYTQNDTKYDYRQIVPVLSLNYSLSPSLSLGYSFKKHQCAPRLAIINDIVSLRNEMEYVVGNPGIRPHNRFEHTATAHYQKKRIRASLMALYRVNPDTWMDEISRGDDGKFYFKKQNKGDVNMLYISNQATWQVIPGHLDVTLDVSFIRCFNFADTYTHCYSAWMGGGSLSAYWGEWSMMASFANGWRCMEGETKIRQGAESFLTLSRRLGGWGSVRIAWQNLLAGDLYSEKTWLMNQNVQKRVTTSNGNLGNMVFATLSINLSRGRHYQSPRRTTEEVHVESTTVRSGGQ